MKKMLVILPVILLLATGCGSAISSNNQSTNNTTPSASQKFSDQSYYNNAYLISTDNLSPEAQLALSGFQLDKKVLPDGTTQITLKALQPEYHDQQYTLKPGEQLYFIDKMLLDDGSGEKNIKDDTAVIVDSQGNIVQPPQDWSK